MKNKSILLIWAALVTIVLLAAFSINRQGPNIIGKDFSDSGDLKWRLDEFYDYIGPTVLNPIDREEAKKKITVTPREIEDHRTYYGSLPEQLSNIQEQYAQRIFNAREEKNEVLREALVAERDTKIEDIKKNFADDAHVEAKIRKEKERALDQFLNEINRNSFSLPVIYNLTDVETGETFSVGDEFTSAIYKKKFDASNGYLKASSLPKGYANGDWSSISYKDTEAHISNEDIMNMANPVKSFEGEILIPRSSAEKGGAMFHQYKDFKRGKYGMYAFWLLGILALIVLFTVMKFQKAWVTESTLADRYANMKIDAKAMFMFLTALVLVGYIDSESSNLLNRFTYFRLGSWGFSLTTFILFGVVATALLAFQIVNSLERYKNKDAIKADFRNSYSLRFLKAVQEVFLKQSIGVQTLILLFGFFLAGIGFVAMFIDGIFFIIYAFCVIFIGLPALFIYFRRMAYLNRIIVATEKMAAGQLNEDIKVEGRSPLADHAKNLNNLREGVRISMTEQAKSERLKTELITNVSHDLRTPLTSIITYTDLLKDEDITPEERAKYIDILDKKSQRLKTLIEDLFEVSKMASGNLELHKQRVDLTQLLQQALAEHANGIAESDLDFRTTLPDESLIAQVDGQKWWRVLDNLIVNAVKYSLPGTRVYVTLRKVGDSAEFVMKNITKYELGENVDELFERFKRADTSRHTDGSGLGLAIAQSIVDMHQGTMKIELDGDLFKVTVTVPTK
ncbi:histidine kinase dimerization/phospho-acceptor domain-containing protein [Sporosarcina highlanderae]|uniref:histidine kinase n=1 Tax=Sporosarcina highlanderae TaxID=3035916 RepID=A0ABT8JM46_9BACL|nr:histidine kinase dimerization/phospho-acceptor domain-containing protein [Sporosarcina highlanderae]MDN4606216.1 histidine kinase dimerization/phospho-acceptor domain-containing protein [Sporosarcina highlanderae]